MGRINLNDLNGVKFNGVVVNGLKLNGTTIVSDEYPITYITTTGSKVSRTWEFFSFMRKPNGNYPTSYKSSEGATIDRLYSSREKPNNGGTYGFYGYFKDVTCTQPFDGVIPVGTKGEVVVYAKAIMTATPFY